MDRIDLNPILNRQKLRETLSQIGEKELLRRLERFMDAKQIDDDTALIKTCNKNLLINTDVLVEDVHFSKSTTHPEDIGWKAITTNYSDLISSGADEFISISVGLIAPPSTEWNWVEGVYKGMENALQKFGGKIIGGDCSKGNQKIISITAIGQLGPLRLHRSYARPGDYLLASGPHGLSRLGLALLISNSLENFKFLPDQLKKKAIETHQRPYPQIKTLKNLQKCKPKNLPWRAAGTDSSDGLLQAIESICLSSNCKAVLNQSQLPKADYWPAGAEWDEWCLNGGEDYELILSLPADWAHSLIETMPNVKKIGIIQAGTPKVIWNNGKTIEKTNISNFKHF
tara:strand:- start:1882 stop:2907 length:1026 start_codon:yes stop_codon:yes gene_type:complete